MGMRPALSVVCIPSENHLEIIFFCVYQLLIASRLGLGSCVHFPSQCWEPICLELYRPCECYQGLCEFACMSPTVSRGLVSLVSFTLTDAYSTYNILVTLSTGEGPFGMKWSEVSHFLSLSLLWISILFLHPIICSGGLDLPINSVTCTFEKYVWGQLISFHSLNLPNLWQENRDNNQHFWWKHLDNGPKWMINNRIEIYSNWPCLHAYATKVQSFTFYWIKVNISFILEYHNLIFMGFQRTTTLDLSL